MRTSVNLLFISHVTPSESRRNVSKCLKTNLEQKFDHYMVRVCFTPQQKDTKQKKNKRTEEIYRFYMQPVMSKIEFPGKNPTYLLGKIYLAWLNILPCNPSIFVSGSFSESRTSLFQAFS